MNKRIKLPRITEYSKTFVKAWKKVYDSGKADMKLVKEVMIMIISNQGDLPEQYRDHELKGNFKGYRECHVKGDLLLVYYFVQEGKGVIFSDLGSHSEIFG